MASIMDTGHSTKKMERYMMAYGMKAFKPILRFITKICKRNNTLMGLLVLKN